MQIVLFVVVSLMVAAAEPAKTRPTAPDVDAIVEQAKQLDPQRQQAWLRRLGLRLKRATGLVLKPAEAEAKAKEYQELLEGNPQDWQLIARLVQQTDVAEKAAIAKLTRQYRIVLYESLFGNRPQYEMRHDALQRVLKAWEASGKPFARQEVLLSWLEEAVRCNTRGSIAPLPQDPDFGKDPPLELPPEAGPSQQPAAETPPEQSKPVLPERPREPAAPLAPDAPEDTPKSASDASAEDERAAPSRAVSSLLRRLGEVPGSQLPFKGAQLDGDSDRPLDPAARTYDSAGNRVPWSQSRQVPADLSAIAEPLEPPVWGGRLAVGATSAGTHTGGSPADGRLRLGAPPSFAGTMPVHADRPSAERLQPPEWPERLDESAIRMPLPAPLPADDGIGTRQLSEPDIQTPYRRGAEVASLPELRATCCEQLGDSWVPVIEPRAMPARRRATTGGHAVVPANDRTCTGQHRQISDSPINLLATRPIPLEQLPRVQVNLADLNARINGYNYSLRALEAELHGEGVWDSARIRPLLERLKRLSAQRSDLEMFRGLLPTQQRNLVAEFEPVRPIVAQVAQRISEARQAAQDDYPGRSAQAAGAELERLEVLSRELAEFGQQ